MNPTINFNEYIEQHKSELLSRAILKGKTIDLVSLMSGVKGATTLNLLELMPTLQSAEDCGFTSTDDINLSQRVLTPKWLKVNLEICQKKLAETYANRMLKAAADNREFIFEKEYLENVFKGIESQLEAMVWQGNSSTNPIHFDGFLTTLKAEGTDTQVTLDPATDSVYDSIVKVYLATAPEIQAKEDFRIFVGTDMFNEFCLETTAKNLFHYDANANAGEYILPGTNAKVIGVPGLIGTNAIVAASASNLVFGTDLISDAETADAWFSNDSRTWKIAVEFVAGAQIAFVGEVAWGVRE